MLDDSDFFTHLLFVVLAFLNAVEEQRGKQ